MTHLVNWSADFSAEDDDPVEALLLLCFRMVLELPLSARRDTSDTPLSLEDRIAWFRFIAYPRGSEYMMPDNTGMLTLEHRQRFIARAKQEWWVDKL